MIEKFKNLIDFINHKLWSVRLSDLPRRKALLYRYLRVLVLSVRKYIEDKLQFPASALTFYSMLSVVPVLALGFGIAKGFGYEKYLAEELSNNLKGHEEVIKYLLDFTNSFLERTQGGLIAGVGMAILFWTVMKVFGNIESAFNDIWLIKKPRSFVRKFSDYLSMMLISPLLIITASSANVFISTQLGTMEERIALLGYISPAIYFLLKFVPYVLIWVLFSFIYIIMPNIKVNVKSGIIAGVVAGSIFQLTQWAYIHFQIGVSNYGAVYGSFAALPLFLVWMQLSWLIVLFGAEISYADHNIDLYEFETETVQISPYAKRILSLLVTHRIVSNFKNCETPSTARELSKELKLPIRLVQNILTDLIKVRIVSEVVMPKPKLSAFQPALNIDHLTVKYVMEKMDKQGHSSIIDTSLNKTCRLLEIHDAFTNAIDRMPENILLKDL
ncbi:MAG TPA: YihY/virulence factor BrkB family protein [Bacteroidales bacterium]|nr:YihY/virulence factor BrkB family protein [Bacteroidales bacterium]